MPQHADTLVRFVRRHPRLFVLTGTMLMHIDIGGRRRRLRWPDPSASRKRSTRSRGCAAGRKGARSAFRFEFQCKLDGAAFARLPHGQAAPPEYREHRLVHRYHVGMETGDAAIPRLAVRCRSRRLAIPSPW